MAIISSLFKQEAELERAADLLSQAGFSNFFVGDDPSLSLPLPGSFFLAGLQRDSMTESNFGTNPNVPLPIFPPKPTAQNRLTVHVREGEKNMAIGLLKRSRAEQITVQ